MRQAKSQALLWAVSAMRGGKEKEPFQFYLALCPALFFSGDSQEFPWFSKVMAG